MATFTKAEWRNVNGYRAVFRPDHNRAMSNDWEGYVYEHILVVEQKLKRPLLKTEVIHHLDGVKHNNRFNNLLILDNAQHSKLHKWLEQGAPGLIAKSKTVLTCKCCGLTLQGKQKQYCSIECSAYKHRIIDRPSKTQLTKELKTMSFTGIGKKYSVSDNAVRKWVKAYNINIQK